MFNFLNKNSKKLKSFVTISDTSLNLASVMNLDSLQKCVLTPKDADGLRQLIVYHKSGSSVLSDETWALNILKEYFELLSELKFTYEKENAHKKLYRVGVFELVLMVDNTKHNLLILDKIDGIMTNPMVMLEYNSPIYTKRIALDLSRSKIKYLFTETSDENKEDTFVLKIKSEDDEIGIPFDNNTKRRDLVSILDVLNSMSVVKKSSDEVYTFSTSFDTTESTNLAMSVFAKNEHEIEETINKINSLLK